MRRGLVGEAAFIVRRNGYRTERIAVPIAEDQEVVVTLRSKPERTAGGAAPDAVTAGPGDKKAAPGAPAPQQAPGAGAPDGDKSKRGKDDAINPFGELLNRMDGEKK